MIWRAARNKPLEIRTWLGNEGLGWFFLERNVDAGGGYDLIARASRAPEADDHLAVQFSVPELEANQWKSLLLRVKIIGATPGSVDMPAFLVVGQDDKIVRAIDHRGKTLNGKPGALTELELEPKLKQGEPGLWDFSVWFS